MPQITLEYTNNISPDIDFKAFLAQAHKDIAELIETKPENCKSRILCRDNYVIGNGDEKNAMLYLTVEILAGRDNQQKAKLSQHLLEVLHDLLQQERKKLDLQTIVYIKDLDTENYTKLT